MKLQSKKLFVICHGEPGPSDVNMVKLATFMGARAELLDWSATKSEGVLASLLHGNFGFAASARTLRQRELRECFRNSTTAGGPLQDHPLFVYGFSPTAEDSDLVREFTGGRFKSVRPLDAGETQYVVSDQARFFCKEFTGLRFGPVKGANDLVFERGRPAGDELEYILVGGIAFLAGFGPSGTRTLLAGSREVADVDARFEPGDWLMDWFSQLVPAMMFMRHAFGDECWQGGRNQACFIVDDPMLKKRYGFLRYDHLFDAMQRSNFATSMAFIPWNYLRTDSAVARLFNQHPERLSLCVHGCDHTWGEFGGRHGAALVAKAFAARERMRRHKELTGIPCDNVMVFPQGIFSPAALNALNSVHYLAAVNGSPFAVDGAENTMRLRDVLQPAVLHYGSLPLFLRHYPKNIAQFAFDLFLGKPALIVEHHGCFRRGYGAIEAFVGQINALSEKIEWRGLEALVQRCGLWRRGHDGVTEVRFYTRQAFWKNEDSQPRRFRFWFLAGPDHGSPSVTLNGRKAAASAGPDGLYVAAELKPGEEVQIQLEHPGTIDKAGPEPGSSWYRMKVRTRRYACEFRDNYVSPGLNALQELRGSKRRS